MLKLFVVAMRLLAAEETVAAKTAKVTQQSLLEDTSRFGGTVTDGNTSAIVSKGFVPETKSNTQWALQVFQLWREWRNSSQYDDQVPDNVMMLLFWISGSLCLSLKPESKMVLVTLQEQSICFCVVLRAT